MEAARLLAVVTNRLSQLRAMKLKKMAYKAKLTLDKWRSAAKMVDHRHLVSLYEESQFNPNEEGIDAFELVVSLTTFSHLSQALASVAQKPRQWQRRPELD